MIRILIADDHPVVRQGLRTILESQPDFSVVAEAGDGISAVQLAEQFEPDVMIVDMVLPRLSGQEVARQIRNRLPATRILMFSIHTEEAYVLQALRSGAHGYALKETNTSELVRAVNQVIKRREYLSPLLDRERIESLMKQAQEERFEVYETLTDREREVLHLAAEGKTIADIGEILSISSRTVETHRNSIMRKLGIHSQTELVKYAIRRGLVPP